MGNLATATAHETVIEIGAMPILVRTDSSEFASLLEERYGSFVNPERHSLSPQFELDVELTPPTGLCADDDVSVRVKDGTAGPRWIMERGDFRAEWDPRRRQGWVRQTVNPYSIDAVLRILHSLILARQGGFLVHAASAVRNGRAFLFAGVSGAGKTTISRLAPSDVTLLTDEISYLRRDGNQEGNGYTAYGTPFAGELARIGENVKAPLEALYLLAQGPENRIETVSQGEALRALLQSILFFAQDHELVEEIFQSAIDFVNRVPVRRLTFVPDARVWELIV